MVDFVNSVSFSTILAIITVVAYVYSLHLSLWASTRSDRLEASRLIDRAAAFRNVYVVALLLWVATLLFT